jgi:hypothetical protein
VFTENTAIGSCSEPGASSSCRFNIDLCKNKCFSIALSLSLLSCCWAMVTCDPYRCCLFTWQPFNSYPLQYFENCSADISAQFILITTISKYGRSCCARTHTHCAHAQRHGHLMWLSGDKTGYWTEVSGQLGVGKSLRCPLDGRLVGPRATLGVVVKMNPCLAYAGNRIPLVQPVSSQFID